MGDAMPPSTTTTGRPKVAVIGSGLAGLATAYLLAEGGVEVWLIEKVSWLAQRGCCVERATCWLRGGKYTLRRSYRAIAIGGKWRRWDGTCSA